VIVHSNLGGNAHLFLFNEKYNMASTMIRIIEFQGGKPVGLQSVMDKHYESTKKNTNGLFTYFEERDSFAVMGDQVRDFFKAHPQELLSEKEKQFRMILDGSIPQWRQVGFDFYLACVADEYCNSRYQDLIPSHVATALWYMDDGYKDQMEYLMEQTDESVRDLLYSKLVEMGCPNDLLDMEFHIAMATKEDIRKDWFKGTGFKVNEEMVSFFNEYASNKLAEAVNGQ
jgi:hypothetical protein